MAKEPSIWVTALVDIKFVNNLFEDLLKHPKYRLIEPYIPTIKVLKKQVKGKKFFQDVPLMLNYGFFKVPKYFVSNPQFLGSMKKDIRCIYSWLIDPLYRKPLPRIYVFNVLPNPMGIALVQHEAIDQIKRQESLNTIYSDKDIKTLYKGQRLTLQCYPFEGLPAEIERIDLDRKKVKVKLLLETSMIKDSNIWVAFENLFFTRYMEDYIESPMKEESIEDINSRQSNLKNSMMKDMDTDGTDTE